MFAFLRTVLSRLAGLFGAAHFDREVDDELRTHLALLTDRFIAQGMTPEDARYAALRQFGGVTPLKEGLRERRTWPQVETTWQDVRYALRQLRKSPGFALAAVLTLALGIGANSTVFTIVNTAFLRPLPVDKPEQLVFLNHGRSVNFSYPDYVDFRDRNDDLSGLTACRFVPVSLSISSGNNSRAWAYEATGNYFDLLGVKPLLGRLFGSRDDDKPGAHPVAVLSYRTWRQRFAADPNIAGRSIRINGLGYTVVGVTAEGFIGTERMISPDLWVPMSMEAQIEPGRYWLDDRRDSNIWVLGRLKPGVSPNQAEASLNRIATQLAHDYPFDEGMHIQLSPPGLLGHYFRKPVMAFTTVLMGVAGVVLLLSCLNLAGLLLARASDRRREMALRLALGARRVRLVRQLLTESLLLALGGGAAGALLALWIARAAERIYLPFDIPANTSLAVDFRVLLFTFAAALLAVVLFGLAPALQTVRVDLVPALKNEQTTGRLRHWHLRDLIVAAQIALSFVLLVSSVLVMRSLRHALDVDLGFQPDGAVSVSFDLGLQGYSEARGRAFQEAVLQKAAALPGVQAVGTSNNVPLRLGTNNNNVSAVGKPIPPENQLRSAMMYDISPGYFAAAGTRLLAGRDIDWRDRAGAPLVAVVNRAFARELFPDETAIGRHFRFGSDPQAPPCEIVGIVEDGKYQSLGEGPEPVVFEPLAQHYNPWTALVVRTSLPSGQATGSLRRLIAEMDPSLPLFSTGSLREQLAYPLFPAHAAAVILGAFGFIAVVLAATGVFALVAYAVSKRTREIGIRMALGAGAGRVLSTVLGRTGILLLAGITAGVLIALVAGRSLSAVLYGVGPNDPPTYAIVLALMAAIGVFSCWFPVRRALRIDPARSLREE
ncbi:MAG: ABC transporter permease [Bryobacteraceae bacterium]